MKILDLYCCSGGSAEGAILAGGRVTGIDIRKPSSYPGRFILKDVRELQPSYLRKFDFIMSSPPCQAFSRSTVVVRTTQGKTYPDYIQLTRDLITLSGKPGFIENVPTAPIKNDITLCGTMFDLRDPTGKQLIRHRKFELINWYTGFKPHYCANVESENIITVVGSDYNNKQHGIAALGLSHLSARIRWEIAQAVPPAYTEWILNRYLNRLTEKRILLNLTTRKYYFISKTDTGSAVARRA